MNQMLIVTDRTSLYENIVKLKKNKDISIKVESVETFKKNGATLRDRAQIVVLDGMLDSVERISLWTILNENPSIEVKITEVLPSTPVPAKIAVMVPEQKSRYLPFEKKYLVSGMSLFG